MLLMPFEIMAQVFEFSKIDQCVDFDPQREKLSECKRDIIQPSYRTNSHYTLRGVYGLSTPYIKFIELCGAPREARKKIKINPEFGGDSDFICFNGDEKWILYSSFSKFHSNNIIIPYVIDYYTCSTLNFRSVIDRLAEKLGPNQGSSANSNNYIERDLRKLGANDVKIYEANFQYEKIEAEYVLDSPNQQFLKCPAAVILRIRIERQPELMNKIEREFAYQHRFQKKGK
jgi:hypothetical protein